jgi:serine/threonine-protein kinase
VTQAATTAPTLDSLSWSRVREAFDHALDLDAVARAQLIDTLSREDAAAARAVSELLAAHARHEGRTDAAQERLAAGVAQAVGAEPVAGARFGAYALEREVGRGGMGVVYAAQRVDGAVERRVAIKVLQRGGYDAASLQRFRAERDLIARLAHPGIARLYDAGETEGGAPYFVMEYVDGVPLTTYCDRERLGIRDRVRLFARVCEAVRYAHGQLVLHRDLKPGNILVDREGNPHLIDFGIARRLDADLASTVTAQRYFSPAHAAPEQVRGDALGVTCDVYQLGTVLYELLCGAPVFDLHERRPKDWEAMICEQVPPGPSQRAGRMPADVAAARGFTQPGALAARLRGDLDNIALRALRKLPHERYASVDRLLDDLQAYLDGRAVEAGGGQAWYRARKFVARNRVGVAVASMFAVTVLAGVAAVLWQARVAQARASELEQVAGFQAHMLEQVESARAGKLLGDAIAAERARVLSNDPDALAAFDAQWARLNSTDIARTLIAQTVLVPAASAVDRQFAAQPEVATRLRWTLANSYASLGDTAAARPLFEQVLAAREAQEVPDPREVLQARLAVGTALQELGDFDAAAKVFDQAYADSRGLGPEDADALAAASRLAMVHVAKDRHEDAIARLVPTLEAQRRVLGNDHPDTVRSVNALAVAYWDAGELAKVEPLVREMLETRRRTHGENHVLTISALSNAGALARDLGRNAEAEALMREALARFGEQVGRDHPLTLVTANMLTLTLAEAGRAEDAERLGREILEARRRTLGDRHPETATSMINHAASLFELGRFEEAEAPAREAVAVFRDVIGPEAAQTWIAQWRLGEILLARGAAREALALLNPMEPSMRKLWGGGDSAFRVARYLRTIGRANLALGDQAAGLARIREACELFARTPGPDPRDAGSCRQTLAEVEAP